MTGEFEAPWSTVEESVGTMFARLGHFERIHGLRWNFPEKKFLGEREKPFKVYGFCFQLDTKQG
jgi:hypothetical protein